jgi:hypothetical protein
VFFPRGVSLEVDFSGVGFLFGKHGFLVVERNVLEETHDEEVHSFGVDDLSSEVCLYD